MASKLTRFLLLQLRQCSVELDEGKVPDNVWKFVEKEKAKKLAPKTSTTSLHEDDDDDRTEEDEGDDEDDDDDDDDSDFE